MYVVASLLLRSSYLSWLPMHIRVRDMSLILKTHPVILAELEILLFTVQAINSQPWRLINVMNNCKDSVKNPVAVRC